MSPVGDVSDDKIDRRRNAWPVGYLGQVVMRQDEAESTRYRVGLNVSLVV